MNRNFHPPSSSQSDYTSVAPPTNINRPHKRVNVNDLPNPLQQYGSGLKFGRQKRMMQDEDDYFEDDDEDHACNPSSYGKESEVKEDSDQQEAEADKEDEEEEEEDPLDAFMAGLDKQVKSSTTKSKANSSTIESTPAAMSSKKNLKSLKGVRDDIDEEDNEESYYRYIEENPHLQMRDDDDEDDDTIDYDADGNPIYKKVKYIDPLPSIDHSKIDYRPFNRNFYIQHSEIAQLDHMQVSDLRKKLGIKAIGVQPPRPVTSFAHFNFDEQLMRVIRKCEYSQPTPIQAQAIPVALSGRDLIGIAKTGSGKTAAFIWPMLVHIMDQPDLKVGDGPIGLILAPTRELSQQIYTETKKFARAYNIRAVCAYGGGSKWEQQQDLEQGAEIIIATPGRLIDLIKVKATNLQRVTMLVLDEADRMFAMGFEAQVRSICDHTRSDRQTLMFSATFKKRVERLARDALNDPIKIIQGELGEANQDVQQLVHVLPSPLAKFDWLCARLTEFCSAGSVLIFVTQKVNAEELAQSLRVREHDLELIHGDFAQTQRNQVITRFKRKEVPILIATDVAARGLDIAHVRTVVNYDIARDIDTHTHRIGRTGRAGVAGVAHTLITEKDKEFAGHLVRNLELSNQSVPDDLLKLAMQVPMFMKTRFKNSKAKDMNLDGGRPGRRRPGIGCRLDDDGDDFGSRNQAKKGGTNYIKEEKSTTSGDIYTGSSSSSSFKQDKNRRFEVMKNAYAAQYKTAFRLASDSSTPTTNVSPSSSAYNSSSGGSSSTSNNANDSRQKKKSRWH